MSINLPQKRPGEGTKSRHEAGKGAVWEEVELRINEVVEDAGGCGEDRRRPGSRSEAAETLRGE